MCIFSRRVDRVSETNIFARSNGKDKQYLVYEMKIKANEDLAMILPIPTPPKSAENAVTFISLKEYPEFFADLRKGFPAPPQKNMPLSRGGAGGTREAKLQVVQVGSFEASFVPSQADFARLDERFRLPSTIWDQLPSYKDYGFAVFKLKPGEKKIHPMAFEFPKSNKDWLFFPTVHVHNGNLPKRAHFDHSLFCQRGSGENFDLMSWEESAYHANQFMKLDKACNIIDQNDHVYRLKMIGTYTNEDAVLAVKS